MKRRRKERRVKQPKIIISGGGTGGHVFPAIAIANAIRKKNPQSKILFVGAEGKIEMEKVPAAGYEIVGLNIRGLQRNLSAENLKFPFRLIGSLMKALRIIKNFKPDVAVGVGGYASGPMLYMASLKKIPYIIQEQNSYAGITNKMLGKKAEKICVAFEGMDKFFPADKILFTGNPLRESIGSNTVSKAEALVELGLEANKKTILVIGGSLGARTLNESVLKDLHKLIAADVQLIWQCGKAYYSTIVENVSPEEPKGVRIFEFISSMDMVYAAADLIISRAGAGTISELCLIKKPVILVPSPNVAEDHQTKNALALTTQAAAILVKDAEAREVLIDTALMLLGNEEKLEKLSENITKLGIADAAGRIADEVLKLANKK